MPSSFEILHRVLLMQEISSSTAMKTQSGCFSPIVQNNPRGVLFALSLAEFPGV